MAIGPTAGFNLNLIGQQSDRDTDERTLFVDQSDEMEELALKIHRDISDAAGMVNAYREEAEVAFKFYNGDQWEELDRLKMEQLKRPAVVFNRIKPTLDAISGLERLNRMDVRVVTRALDSKLQNDMTGDLATESRVAAIELCNGDDERSRAALDMAIGGMGWVEVRTDYEHDIDGRVILECLPWREMWWDHNCIKECLEDSEWRARQRPIGRRTFKKLWGEEILAKVDAAAPDDWEERRVGRYELVTPYYSRQNEQANPQVGQATQNLKSIPVIQYQWRDMVPVYRFLDPTNPQELTNLDEDSWKRLVLKMRLIGKPAPPAVRQLRPVYKQAFVARGVVLEEPIQLPGSFFSLLCMTGIWNSSAKHWYGFVRPMMDPQRTMNKSMSSSLTFMLTNAKGGVMYESDAFVDPINAKEQWSRPDAFIELNAGGAQKIVQRQTQTVSTDLQLFFTESYKAIAYTSGINDEIIGMAQGQTPSPTAQSRVQGGMAIIGWFFDAVARHTRNEARVMLEFIREFWTQGQLIRVGGEANAQAIPLFKKGLPLDYDLVLDESVKHNPNLKAQVWNDLQPIIPSLLRFGFGSFLLEALKFSPLPAQLVAKLQQMGQQQGPNPPQKGRGKQVDPQEQQAKIQKMSAEGQRALAQARAIDQEQKFKIAELAMDSFNQARSHQQDENARHNPPVDPMQMIRMLLGNTSQPQDQMPFPQMPQQGSPQGPQQGFPPQGPPPQGQQ
jgi:hypothetical protein